jgi:hypothetical protein
MSAWPAGFIHDGWRTIAMYQLIQTNHSERRYNITNPRTGELSEAVYKYRPGRVIAEHATIETTQKHAEKIKTHHKDIEFEIHEVPRRTIRVTFADGNTLATDINGTEQEIRDYYLNNYFNLGDDTRDNMQRGVSVEFLDKESN